MKAIRTTRAYRAEFVQSLIDQGSIRSARVKKAFLRVKRHHFVREWLTLSTTDGVPAWTLISIDLLNLLPRHLETVYSDKFLVTSVNGVTPSGSLSAPPLVAKMLEHLDVQEGMNVLEIGTCSGYNAALLAELVATDGGVHSVENRADAAKSAIKILSKQGYEHVEVYSKDGYFGVPESSPFDRIIATVGCSDISPHWIEQLHLDGQMLIPLQYGWMNYLMLVIRDKRGDEFAHGRIVGKSNFMPIQGILSWANPWRSWSLANAPATVFRAQELPGKLPPSDPMIHPLSDTVHSDFYYFLTLSGHKLWYCNEGYGLADPLADAKAIVTHDSLKCFGPSASEASGRRLLERLLWIYEQWRDFGCPRVVDYRTEFIPKHSFYGPTSTFDDSRWIIERVHHLEEISLRAAATN